MNEDEEQITARPESEASSAGVPRVARARARRGRGSRRGVWTAAKKQQVLAILAVGGTKAGAARYVGCGRATLGRLAARDAEFREQMRQAQAAPEVVCLQRIVEAAKETKNWRAAAWALERRFPERYGRRGAGMVSPDALRAFVEQLGAIVAEEVGDEAARRRILARLRRLVRRPGAASRNE